MSVNGPYPVDSVALFPGGLYAVGEVSRCTEFGSPRDNPVQLRDKVTGQPMWQFDVMDADPEARKSVRMFRVKIPSVVAPVLPDPIPGTTLRPVVLEGLQIFAYLPRDDQDRPIAQIEYAVRATGVVAPRRDAKAA